MEMVENSPATQYIDFVNNLAYNVAVIAVSRKESELLVDAVDFLEAGFGFKPGDELFVKGGLSNVFKLVSCVDDETIGCFNRINEKGECFIFNAHDLHVNGFNVRVPLKYQNPKEILFLLLQGSEIYTEDGVLLEFDLNTLALRTVNDKSEGKVTCYEQLEFGGKTLPTLYVNRTTFLTSDEVKVLEIKKLLNREIDLTAEELRLIIKHKIL